DRTLVNTSADGRTVTYTVDNDGNGIDERTYTIVTEADGSQIETVQDFDNKTGSFERGSTNTVSADGLVSTVKAGLDNTSRYTDTSTTFANANGSYQWVRSVASSIVGSSSHTIDENGIDTWSWNISAPSAFAQTTGDTLVHATGKVVIDVATEQQYEG